MKDWIRDLALKEEMDKEPPYYIDENGNTVFTAYFLRRRGFCCGNGCRNCPYTPKHQKGNTKL